MTCLVASAPDPRTMTIDGRGESEVGRVRIARIAAATTLAVALAASSITAAGAERARRSAAELVDCSPTAGGAVRELRVPLTRATNATVHAAGDSVVVLARRRTGSSSSIIGTALDCTRRRWTAMPAAPFASDLANRGVVWTGRELLVVGVPCSPDYTDVDLRKCDPPFVRAAAWSPTRNRWRTVRLSGSSFGRRRLPAGTATVGLGMAAGRAVVAFDVSGGRRLALVDPRTGTTELTSRFGNDLTPCVTQGRVTLSRWDGVTQVWGATGWSAGSAPAAAPVRVHCGAGLVTALPQAPRPPGADDAIQTFDPAVEKWRPLPPPPVPGLPGDGVAAAGAASIALAFVAPPSIWTTDVATLWRAHPLPVGWTNLDARSSPQPVGARFVVAPYGGPARIGLITP